MLLLVRRCLVKRFYVNFLAEVHRFLTYEAQVTNSLFTYLWTYGDSKFNSLTCFLSGFILISKRNRVPIARNYYWKNKKVNFFSNNILNKHVEFQLINHVNSNSIKVHGAILIAKLEWISYIVGLSFVDFVNSFVLSWNKNSEHSVAESSWDRVPPCSK